MSQRILHEGKTGRFCLEDVVLPSGHRTRLEILHHPGAAAAVPFLTRDRILLLRQYRHAAGGWLWEVPAGKLDPGEDPLACMQRELEEETGYRAGRIEPLGEILTTPGFSDERIWLFAARDLTRGTMAHGASELIEVHEVAFDEAMAMIAAGEIVDGKTLAALHHAARLR